MSKLSKAIEVIQNAKLDHEDLIDVMIQLGAFYGGEKSKEGYEDEFGVDLYYDEYKGVDSVSVLVMPFK